MLKQIIKSHNGTIIVPYRNYSLKQLEFNTMTYDKVYHKQKEVSAFHVDYKGMPALVTYNVDNHYLSAALPDYKFVERKMIKPIILSNEFSLKRDIVPTDVQSSVIVSILSDINSNSKYREWFVNLQTGYGKTLLSVYLSSVIKYKTLIMCFSTEILLQWMKTFAKMSTINTDRVLLIDNSKILDKICNNAFDPSDFDIYMCTPKLLTSYSNRKDNEVLETIFQNLGIGLKIFDEAHRNKANLIKINAYTNVKYSIYLSADYAQGNPREERMYYDIFKTCKIVVPDSELVKDMRYTNAVVVEFDSKPTLIEGESIYNRYGYSANQYMKYEIDKGVIFNVVDYILASIFKSNTDRHRILILMNMIDHVDSMTDYLSRYSDTYKIGRYHSKVSNDEKEITKESADIIVSTYSSFSTGMDINDIKYVISLNQCNKIEDNQAAGRARPLKDGSDAFYFMLIDGGISYCKNKLKTRLKYLNDTKVKSIYHIKYV